MTTEPTRTATPPTSSTPRMPGRSARIARRVLTGATLVLAAAGTGMATAGPASAEVGHFENLIVNSACKSPGNSGPVPNAYYVDVTLLGGSSDKTFTFDSLSIKGGPALAAISPKQVTVPAHQGDTTVTLLVEGASNSGSGVGSLTTHVVGSGFTAID
ncbi:MAG: hypothetical protein ABJA89_16495, partial [Lapillicoccus sp.]